MIFSFQGKNFKACTENKSQDHNSDDQNVIFFVKIDQNVIPLKSLFAVAFQLKKNNSK